MSSAIELELKRYFFDKLLSITSLKEYLEVSSVVSVEIDQEIVYDLMVFVPDHLFNSRFKTQFGESFVVNDKEYSPPVFTRFKNYQWLRKDFSNRLPIALWIFRQAIVANDPCGRFKKIISDYSVVFARCVKDIIRRKYIEFRSDRHNLRQSVCHRDDLAINLLRANVVKIAIEILILANDQPYPYKKWLPFEAKKYEGGSEIVQTCIKFIKEKDNQKVIVLSDDLVSKIVDTLARKNCFSLSFLNQWWLHLI